MPACPSCQWEILKAISPEIILRLKRKNKDCGRCIGRWMGCKEVIITVWHWSMRKHLYTQYYKEISTGMWCMPTSIAPEAVIAAAGTGSLARSTVRHSVSLIIKSLLLPATEHAHLLSLLLKVRTVISAWQEALPGWQALRAKISSMRSH